MVRAPWRQGPRVFVDTNLTGLAHRFAEDDERIIYVGHPAWTFNQEQGLRLVQETEALGGDDRLSAARDAEACVQIVEATEHGPL